MTKFRNTKTGELIEAVQWRYPMDRIKFKEGGQFGVTPHLDYRCTSEIPPEEECGLCHQKMKGHGWIFNGNRNRVVCSNMWIINDGCGTLFLDMPGEFEATYESVAPVELVMKPTALESEEAQMTDEKNMHEMIKPMTVAQAREVMIKAFEDEPSFLKTYVANIAMHLTDRYKEGGQDAKGFNQAAESIMGLLFPQKPKEKVTENKMKEDKK